MLEAVWPLVIETVMGVLNLVIETIEARISGDGDAYESGDVLNFWRYCSRVSGDY